MYVAAISAVPPAQRWSALFDASPVGIAVVDAEGRVLQVNAALCSMLECEAAGALSLDLADLLHPDDLPNGREMLTRLHSGEPATVQAELRWCRRTGGTVIGATSATLLRTPDGAGRQFVLHIRDVSAERELERLLTREKQRLRESQSIGRLGSWEVDAETKTVTWSDALFELRGLDPATFDGDFSAATQFVHPDDRSRVRSAIEAATDTGEQTMLRYRAFRADDHSERWFDARFKGIFEDGRMVTLSGTVVDVTEDVLAQEKARAAYTFQQAVFTASPDITFVYDLPTSSTVWSSRPVLETLGYPAADAESFDDNSLTALIPEADRTTFDAALTAAQDADDDDVVSVSYRLVDASNRHRWFSRRTTALRRDESGRVSQVVGVLRDITEAKAVEQRLQHSALHDNLTGLANRALLVDRVQGALLRSARDRREVSILFCDLDGFKRVNDTSGHAAGDAVLIETARRLEGVLREGDTVARVGGDEFVLVVEPWNRPDNGTGTAGTAASDRRLGPQIADRVARALRKPIEFNGIEHVISASIGITYGPIGLESMAPEVAADALLQDADAAMYTAKRRGKDRIEIFEHGMRTDVVERGRVERVLRRALRSAQAWPANPPAATGRVQPDRLWPVYQPIFSARTGALTGFEALARLADGSGDEIPPDVFVPIAEETGLIRALGAFMLDRAVGQLTAWRERYPLLQVTMAVNVSALQVGHASLVDDVGRALRTHGRDPADLVLELTETALLQASLSSIATLHTLRRQGMGIAIDDFGVGYASLKYLATMPVSAVKIDKSFTAGLPGDLVSRKIVSAIAALAADLSLNCTVEGVETIAQRAALPDAVHIQGWLTGAPQQAHLLDLATMAAGLAPHPA